MEETWSNTDQILQKNGVTKVQVALGMSVIISLSTMLTQQMVVLDV